MSTVPHSGIIPPVGRLLLGGLPVNRNDSAASGEELLQRSLAEPGTKVLVLSDGRAPVEERDGTPRIAWRRLPDRLSDEPWESLRGRYARLGTDRDGADVVLDIAEVPWADVEAGDPWAPPEGAVRQETWAGLREAAERLEPEDTTWFTTGLALAHWHASSPYCSVCGGPTSPAHGGWARVCATEGTDIFPRTDPAIITAVVHTDHDGVERLLLGQSARWPEGRFSTFAGFVEAGESLESAVAREVLEESGVTVTDARYLGSQPWPFPRSLMLGFRAEAAAREDAVADGREIAQVRWFTKEELATAVREGEVVLPGPVSIAHHLIADWYGDTLPEREEAGSF